MNKNQIIVGVLVCLCLLSLSLTGCGEEATAPSETVTIVDYTGQSVDVPCPVERVVVILPTLARLVYALECEDKIVGVTENCKFPPELEDKPNVGSSGTPNLELLLELDPDVVIADRHLKIREQIEEAGVPVIFLSTYSPDDFLFALDTLGLILDREDRADELAGLVCDQRDLVVGRTDNLEAEEKPLVFYEWAKPYYSSSALSPAHERLVMAGGTNIAADEPVSSPLVNAEWVVERNPQILIHSIYFGGVLSPPDAEERLSEKRDEIMNRPGLSAVDAVEDDNVYVINMGLTSDFGGIMGVVYFAKWFHPDLFEDIDPEAIHSELLQEFYGTEREGTWVYPE